MKKLISIIVPIYNCDKYIENCINSLLNQTYSNIEIVLVDDGSTDNSLMICKNMAKTDSRVKVYHQNNMGVSSARNYGIGVSKGDFLTFVDCDDWVDENYCMTLINGFDDDVQLSVVGIKMVNNLDKAKFNMDDKYQYQTQEQAYKSIFRDSNFFGFPVNKMYRRDIIVELGDKPFDETIYACEDTLFNARYLQKCNKIAYNKTPLYFYYQRSDSATKIKNFNEKKLSVFKSLDEIEKIYLNVSYTNLVYLYIFYLYNYYLIQLLIYHTHSSYKLSKDKIKEVYKYVLKSDKISFLEKIKITIKYKVPRVNDFLVKIKKKIKKGDN